MKYSYLKNRLDTSIRKRVKRLNYYVASGKAKRKDNEKSISFEFDNVKDKWGNKRQVVVVMDRNNYSIDGYLI